MLALLLAAILVFHFSVPDSDNVAVCPKQHRIAPLTDSLVTHWRCWSLSNAWNPSPQFPWSRSISDSVRRRRHDALTVYVFPGRDTVNYWVVQVWATKPLRPDVSSCVRGILTTATR